MNEETKCLVNLTMSNYYIWTKNELTLNRLQKWFIFSHINRGIIYMSLQEQFLIFIALRLLFLKQKSKAFYYFEKQYPYSQGLLLGAWVYAKYNPNYCAQLLLPKQLEFIRENKILEQPLLHDRKFISNRLEELTHNTKVTSEKKKWKLVDTPEILLDRSTDKYAIRQIKKFEIDKELQQKIQKALF
ncbi:hypothetical protein pb186bvf_002632 [Paramecium bursaria]